jgi:glutaredoxin 3
MSVPVQVYVTTYCPYCVRAKSLLDKRGIPYETIDVGGDDAKRQWLVDVTGRRTVPQIFIDGKAIGGCDDLYDLDRAGELMSMVKMA